jgi:hypothetical protein
MLGEKMIEPKFSNEFLMETLKRYIQHVGECEGVDFLSDRNKTCFTPEQWALLQEARQE